MIEKITIKGIATYPDESQELCSLSKFNYLYGSNGSGKTTISRIISDNEKYKNYASIQWKNNHPLKAMVYNLDFVENNLKQSERVKGVFTLGQLAADTVNRIEELKKNQKETIGKKGQKVKSLKGESDVEVGGEAKRI